MAAATARAKGRSKEGRETERGRGKGRQPMTERNMLSPIERQQKQDLPTGRYSGNETEAESDRPEKGERENTGNREREREGDPKLISICLSMYLSQSSFI